MSDRSVQRPKSVGVDVPRVEVMEKLTGAALYTGDLLLPGMLHAKLKKSPHARARIVSIDTSRAEALPGVHAVLPVASSTTASACTSSTRTSWPGRGTTLR